MYPTTALNAQYCTRVYRSASISDRVLVHDRLRHQTNKQPADQMARALKHEEFVTLTYRGANISTLPQCIPTFGMHTDGAIIIITTSSKE